MTKRTIGQIKKSLANFSNKHKGGWEKVMSYAKVSDRLFSLIDGRTYMDDNPASFNEIQDAVRNGFNINGVYGGRNLLRDGYTPLTYAVHLANINGDGYGHILGTTWITKLRSMGADINGFDARGHTPLMQAVVDRKAGNAWFLTVHLKARKDLANDNGDTALHLAAREGALEIAKTVYDKRLLSVRNKEGMTPREVAEENGRKETAQFLSDMEKGYSSACWRYVKPQRKSRRRGLLFSSSHNRKLHQRNFSYEGNNLVDKCRIINGNLFGDDEDNWLSPEDMIKFLEKCRETWTCRATKNAPDACTHLIDVLKFFVDGDERPESLAVYRPSEIVASSTKPLVLLGVEEPAEMDLDRIIENIKYLAYRVYGADSENNSIDLDKNCVLFQKLAEYDWKYFRDWQKKRIESCRSDAIDETKDLLWCDITYLTGHDDLLANLPAQNYVDEETGEIYDDSLFEDIATALVDKYFPKFEKEAFLLWDRHLKTIIDDAEFDYPIYSESDIEEEGFELIKALRDGSKEDVRKAIVNGADVNAYYDTLQNTPVAIAAKWSDNELLKLLIDAGASVNTSNEMKETPIMFTVSEGNVEGTKLLIAAGADLNKRNYADATALTLALWEPNPNKEIIDILRRAGAKE